MQTAQTSSAVAEPQRNHRILRKRAVLDKAGLSHSELYRKIKTGSFPAPVALGPQAVGWHECEVDAWIEARPRVALAHAA